jgi:type I restriction enzyme S subunit
MKSKSKPQTDTDDLFQGEAIANYELEITNDKDLSTKGSIRNSVEDSTSSIRNSQFVISNACRLKPSGIPWLGDIPEHWELKKLKHITKVISKGTTPSTEGFETLEVGAFRFLKAENLIDNSLAFLPEFYIDEKTNNALSRSILEEKDILIVIAGATIGKVAILENEFLPANTNQAVCFIRLMDIRSCRFIWYYFRTDFVRNLILINSVQSAQPNISMSLLKELALPIPPVPEQKAIAKYLDRKTGRIDSLISKKEKLVELLKEKRGALISSAVTGKLTITN